MNRQMAGRTVASVDSHRATLLAYANGATCEYLSLDGRWYDVTEMQEWSPDVRYRIKPEPKLRAYNREELNALVGQVLLIKPTGRRFVVTSGPSLTSADVCVGQMRESAQGLLDRYTHENGSPCGITD